jgi:tRNA U34 2-thiouridine synthase MnmA/TrmU
MKAIALISGGLDSILAARVIKEEGIEVIPLYFKIPFCHRIKENAGPSSLVKNNLGSGLKTVDISSEFLKVLARPRYGFGSNMNPCIDCKILMLSKAKELMPELGAQFVVTGEVLGQRPMSQHRQALELIEKKSGLEGLLLRPLSAKLLPQTLPEKEGWVSREKLLDFGGRSRKPQIALAQKFAMKDYPNAAGGCLLTDPEFAKRLKELTSHQELKPDNIELLKIGRHFRLSEHAKLIVGRDEKEDKKLEESVKDGDYLFMPTQELAGPTSLGRGEFNEGLIEFSCRITCSYCDLNGSKEAEIIYRKMPKKTDNILKVMPVEKDELAKIRI